ncbi:hypothetical protein HNP46_000108 [Pseudomonas nitritireducens]|uniref:Uncharacterized protein n=1 Tax=Pseudomonas nitroreducens TaxID=46680 RepID=A0A7W7KEE0_PSENT|nr:hypothetical protein [Pseudomonas nitritireducens]MBB4861297.1 hypothetical protein [Pseudomonas nitritireducens]
MVDATLLIELLSPEGSPTEAFNVFAEQVSRSKGFGIAVSTCLLRDGKNVCRVADEERYRALADAVVKSSGLGKGIFTRTILSMPEPFARVQLKLWAVADLTGQVKASDWQSTLSESIRQGRARLARDIMDLLEMHYGLVQVVGTLSEFDPQKLEDSGLLAGRYRDQMVSTYLRNKQFLSGAIAAGDDEACLLKIRREIGIEVGEKSPNPSWVQLMRRMAWKTKGFDGGDALKDHFKSAAHVVVDNILKMNDWEVDSQLDTDEVRLMAFKLGRADLVEKMGDAGQTQAMSAILDI